MTQLDLFGVVEAEAERASDIERDRAAWAGRFERADWAAPEPMADGRPAGTVFHGWRCPDPECGEVAASGFVLSINHGFDPDIPGRAPWHGRCFKVWRRQRSAAPLFTDEEATE